MTIPHRPAESSSENLADTHLDTHIDRALTALRTAEPRGGPEQMEQRLLHSLAQRTAAPTPQPNPLTRLQNALRGHISLTATAATAAIALLTVSALLLHRPNHPSPGDPFIAQPHRAMSGVQTAALSSRTKTSSGGPFIAQPHRAMSGVQTAALSSRTKTSSGGPFIAQPHRAMSGVRTATIQTTTPDEATLLADLHAPSHPAPPLPLTPQEKAILAVLRHGNAVDLASLSDLDPVIRATRDDDETTAFRAFFPDPPPIPQPTGDTE